MKWANEQKTLLDLENGTVAALQKPDDLASIGSGPVRREVVGLIEAGALIAPYEPPQDN